MITQYTTHVIKALHASELIKVDQLAKIMDMPLEDCQKIIDSLVLTNTLTLTHVDRLVNFLGVSVFNPAFVKDLFIPTASSYRSWDSLDSTQRAMVNTGTAYTTIAHHKETVQAISYAKECCHFLDSCELLITTLKDSDSEDTSEDTELSTTA